MFILRFPYTLFLSSISVETMNKVLINKQLEENNSSSNFKCFLHCLFTKYGWMDEDGGFLIHNMKSVLDEVQLEVASLEYVLFKCTAIGSIDKCERSFLFTECFWKKAVQKSAMDDQFFYNIGEKK
ncbi:hypothetical protein ILUMI_23307 [Ignelater luminosus]|uniref:Uncharacterized protein n=1 Tax=Ignelater luminosus TaxID=2038154 RepID=A0A8K0FWY7_IGNLU|nr:hypothetical protein ILUMI_23307 [Ignelater luminosus]